MVAHPCNALVCEPFHNRLSLKRYLVNHKNRYGEILIGDRLKQIRKEKGLTQKAFAEILTTSSGYISEIENNKNAPGNSLLISLKRNLCVSIDWLLTGDGNPYFAKDDEDSIVEKEEDYSELSELLQMTREIIRSDTSYSASLMANIRSFHQAVLAERRFHDLEKRISKIERKNSDNNTKIRAGDPPEEKEEITKRRAM